jgi:hypothetical protein
MAQIQPNFIVTINKCQNFCWPNTYDHVELNFYVNGANLNCPVLGIRGTVYPIAFVDDGAILDVAFEKFR